jgi:mono/diheme cytochrome c family protein
MFRTLTLAILVTLAADAAAHAQSSAALDALGGKELYAAGCAACHGADGKGQPKSVVGFDLELPDFSDCSFSTPEQNADWLAITHEGGPVRAFDRKMPAFGGVLSDAAAVRVLDYIRGFCGNPSWPRGELNLPRPLVTEKAFPENEGLVTMSMSGGDAPAVTTRFIYERRIGPRSQVELIVPVQAHDSINEGWRQGLGDFVLAFKHAFFHDFSSGSIASLGAEAVFPTGSEGAGLGKGTAVVEPFVAVGQILPADSFVQFHAGVELPVRTGKAGKEAFWRTAFGKTFVQSRFGRAWSPIVELVAARELSPGEPVQWDVVPQLQVSLSRRQHILINGGVRIPITRRHERDVQVLTYFLWDWFDGGLFEGW